MIYFVSTEAPDFQLQMQHCICSVEAKGKQAVHLEKFRIGFKNISLASSSTGFRICLELLSN